MSQQVTVEINAKNNTGSALNGISKSFDNFAIGAKKIKGPFGDLIRLGDDMGKSFTAAGNQGSSSLGGLLSKTQLLAGGVALAGASVIRFGLDAIQAYASVDASTKKSMAAIHDTIFTMKADIGQLILEATGGVERFQSIIARVVQFIIYAVSGVIANIKNIADQISLTITFVEDLVNSFKAANTGGAAGVVRAMQDAFIQYRDGIRQSDEALNFSQKQAEEAFNAPLKIIHDPNANGENAGKKIAKNLTKPLQEETRSTFAIVTDGLQKLQEEAKRTKDLLYTVYTAGPDGKAHHSYTELLHTNAQPGVMAKQMGYKNPLNSSGGLNIQDQIDKIDFLGKNTPGGAKIAKMDMMNDLRDQFAESIANSLVDGIEAGFTTAFATGNIGKGFAQLSKSLLGGLGKAMMEFGKASLLASTFMEHIKKSLSSFLPGGAIVASIAMIALGAALSAAAGSAFGGSSGGSGYTGAGMGAGGEAARVINGVLQQSKGTTYITIQGDRYLDTTNPDKMDAFVNAIREAQNNNIVFLGH